MALFLYQTILEAFEAGNFKEVEELLEVGADPNRQVDEVSCTYINALKQDLLYYNVYMKEFKVILATGWINNVTFSQSRG